MTAQTHTDTIVRRRKPIRITTILKYIALTAGALVSLFPFYWMFILATHPSSAIFKFPPDVLPGDRLGTNIETITSKINIWAAMGNTCLLYTSPSPRDS